VEVPAGGKYDSMLQVRYQQYLAGTYKLPANEVQQIGFRLAKLLSHPRVYAIDANGRFEFGELMQYAQRHGQDAQLKRQIQQVDSALKVENDVLRRSTLTEYYHRINQPAVHQQYHDWYLRILRYGAPQEQAGGRLVGDYYARNVNIVANLMQVPHTAQDRVLVIYGNGHTSFFKSILFGSSDYEVVEASAYLK
jgi:hypothetical protein